MMRNELDDSSAKRKARMRAVEWVPEGEPKAVLHIFQSRETAESCQEELAEYFKEHGFAVIDSCCPDIMEVSQMEEAIGACFHNVKCKYPDIPYLLLGLSQGAVPVHAFVTAYPEAVEGLVFVDTRQNPQNITSDIPTLKISGLKEKKKEAFQSIYRWTEERLDEMLYHAAMKQ